LLPFVDLAERGGDPVVHFLGPLSMMGAVSAVEPPPRRENVDADAWALLPAAARWGFRLQPDGRCVDGFRVGYFAGPTAASNLGAIVFYAGTDDDDAPTPHPALLPRGRLNLPTDASVVVNLLGLGESIRPEERAAMQTVLNERHAAAYTSPEVALALTFNLVHCGLAATGFYGTNLHSTPPPHPPHSVCRSLPVEIGGPLPGTTEMIEQNKHFEKLMSFETYDRLIHHAKGFAVSSVSRPGSVVF
jgi:hypothetical protein